MFFILPNEETLNAKSAPAKIYLCKITAVLFFLFLASIIKSRFAISRASQDFLPGGKLLNVLLRY